MFKPTTAQLWLELKAAMEETENHASGVRDLLRRMTGRFYRKENRNLDTDPENWGYAFVSNMLPTLGVRDPKVKIQAARVIGHKIVAQAMTDGMNSWINDVHFGNIAMQARMDFLWLRGVLLHYIEEDTRWSRGLVTPVARRINPRRFFQDSLAEGPDLDAFRGHWYFADVEDLMNDNRVTAEAKAVLAPSDDANREADTSKGAFVKKSGQQLGRRRVKCYSIWMRDTNTLRVLFESSQSVELYPERPYYGDPSGPYTLYDAYPIPDQSWPLSPMVAVEDQNRDLNIHARAMGRAAARRKTVGLVEASNTDLGNKLKNAEDGEILVAKGITGNHVIIEMTGATQEQYTYTEYARARLDRISGLTATVQGSVGEADTATEAEIANNALSNRTKFLKLRTKEADTNALRKVGWQMFHTEGIVIPVNSRDSYTGELMEGAFFGGPTPLDGGAQWDDFSIRVEVQDESDNAKQDLLGFYQIFTGIAQSAPSMPWVRWVNVARDFAEVFNVPDKAEEWLIAEMLGAFGQPPQFPPSMVMGAQQVPGQEQPLQIHPRTGAPSNPTGSPGGGQPGGAGFGNAGGNGFNTQGAPVGPRPGGGGGAGGFGGVAGRRAGAMAGRR